MFGNRFATGVLTAASIALGLIGHAGAQSYPSKVIKIIVPLTAGGGPDAAARAVAHHLQNRLGQSIVIENRPGAGSTTGTMAVATAAPDGYTLLFNGSNFLYYPVLYPNLDFDPVRSLAPVATVVAWSHVMVVAPSVPAKTIAELIAYARFNPGKLNFGFGLGTTPHILGASFKEATATDIAFIPYRGGDQARADLLGGHIHINFATVASVLALIQEGKVRPLAFTGPTRSPDLPDVPTMIESRLPQVGYNPDTWFGFLAPPGTPIAVINKLNTEINESLKSPEMRATLAGLGFEAKTTTPQEFAVVLAAGWKKWPPLLRAAGLKAE